MGTRASDGYRKGETKDSPLLVDEEAAVVKRIFAMCAGGIGLTQIAKQLKEERIYSHLCTPIRNSAHLIPG